jgi:hypothetical protein
MHGKKGIFLLKITEKKRKNRTGRGADDRGPHLLVYAMPFKLKRVDLLLGVVIADTAAITEIC